MMLCDELKSYNVVATADVNPKVVDSLGCTEWTGYDKNEVDAAIAELKAENRRLKRALWMARAEKNELLSNYRNLDNYMYGLMVDGKRSHYEDYENHADSYNEWTTKLSNAAQVCRVKAEEYK